MIINLDKDLKTMTPEDKEFEKKLKALESSTPENLRELAQKDEESRQFFRQLRVYERNKMAEMAHIRIGGIAHTR